MKWHQKALVRIFSSNILTFLFQLIAWCSVSLLIAIDKLGEFNLHVYLGALPIVIIQALVMKGTTLTELIRTWEDFKGIISRRAHMSAGYPDRKRWREIMRVHKRRLVRGKAINRAYRVAKKLDHLEYLQWMNDIRGKKAYLK